MGSNNRPLYVSKREAWSYISSNNSEITFRQTEITYELRPFGQESDHLPKNTKTEFKSQGLTNGQEFRNKSISSAELDRLRNENFKMKTSLTCLICEESRINVVTLPCRHLVVCLRCGEDIWVCPACGRDIKYKLKATF